MQFAQEFELCTGTSEAWGACFATQAASSAVWGAMTASLLPDPSRIVAGLPQMSPADAQRVSGTLQPAQHHSLSGDVRRLTHKVPETIRHLVISNGLLQYDLLGDIATLTECQQLLFQVAEVCPDCDPGSEFSRIRSQAWFLKIAKWIETVSAKIHSLTDVHEGYAPFWTWCAADFAFTGSKRHTKRKLQYERLLGKKWHRRRKGLVP